jgi:Endonuclease NucS
MTLWKINCMENKFPGMWQRWYRNQCVAVGWRSTWGYPLTGPMPRTDYGWSRTRNALQRIKIGDYVVVSLRGNRVGRLGRVTDRQFADTDWRPLVPPGLGAGDREEGEMGRRILVRWDLTVGPDDRDMVVRMPKGSQFTNGELRPTLSEIKSLSVSELTEVMADRGNWESLLAHFDYEKALSGYIATYPYHLEDGLTQHPNQKVREKVYDDRTRSDVILLDRGGMTVIVECKQRQPEAKDVEQLRRYIRGFYRETKLKARGILVHGGSKKLHADVEVAASKAPKIEVIQHSLTVAFSRCN